MLFQTMTHSNSPQGYNGGYGAHRGNVGYNYHNFGGFYNNMWNLAMFNSMFDFF